MSAPLLEARELRVVRGARAVLDGVSLTLEPGARVAIVGANGSGKSTLLRALLGLEPGASGELLLEGAHLRALSRVAVARTATLVLQDTHLELPITVRDLVELGRYPHRGTPQAANDRSCVEHALEEARIAALAERDVRTLSGGELQRAHLARALAQDTRVLLLDEPTSSLDLGHQIEVLRALSARADSGVAVCIVLHDLGLAARWAERVVILERGRILAEGPPRTVLDEPNIARAFGVSASVGELDGALVVLPRRPSTSGDG